MATKRKQHTFQFFFGMMFILFFGLLSFVTFTAYSRKSSSTGMTLVKMQQLRVDTMHR